MTKRDVAVAFANGKTAKCHNAGAFDNRYILHGTVICTREEQGRVYIFNWGGYFTRTTANHMNEIIDAANLGQRVSYATARDAGERGFYRYKEN